MTAGELDELAAGSLPGLLGIVFTDSEVGRVRGRTDHPTDLSPHSQESQ